VCLNFFHGEGYSAEFVVNLMRTLESWDAEPGVVVEGTDDVCSACPSRVDEAKCILLGEQGRGVKELDELALDLLEVAPGDRVTQSEIRAKIRGMIHEWRARACVDCDWEPTCHASLDLVEKLP
jgi:hypothetical protein